jgi:uncharacterized protein YqfA (UPF0365 family)
MSIPVIVVLAIAVIIGLVIFGIVFSIVGAWVKAMFNGAPVGIGKLVALKFASIPYNVIVDARITAVRAGIALSADQIASHFQAGGNVVPTVQALIAAQKAGIELGWDRACAIDLATKGSGKSPWSRPCARRLIRRSLIARIPRAVAARSTAWPRTASR